MCDGGGGVLEPHCSLSLSLCVCVLGGVSIPQHIGYVVETDRQTDSWLACHLSLITYWYSTDICTICVMRPIITADLIVFIYKAYVCQSPHSAPATNLRFGE